MIAAPPGESRVALVTGATSGIGVEIARRLVADGLRVVVSGRSAARGAAVAAELGGGARFLPADLTENVFAAIACLQAAGRAMRDGGRGGAIITITSRLASIGVPTMSVDSASKGAMLALTTAAAVELAPHDIRVNAVAPGMTRTPLFESWVAEQADPAATERQVAAAIPLRRIAEPADVAAAVAYLASPGAAYVTGTSIPVDGGYLAQ